MEQKSNGTGLIGAALILGIAIVGSSYMLSNSLDRVGVQFQRTFANLESFKPAAPSPSRASNKPDPKKVYQVAIGNAPFKGPKDAKVTIVEFSDFQ